MGIPETWWVDPAWKFGALIVAAVGGYKALISQKAVDTVKVKATFELVDRHEVRIRTLEDAKIQMGSDVSSMKVLTEKMSDKIDKGNDTTQQILGEVRAMTLREKH